MFWYNGATGARLARYGGHTSNTERCGFNANAHASSGSQEWYLGAYGDFGIKIHTFAMFVLVVDVMLDYLADIFLCI